MSGWHLRAKNLVLIEQFGGNRIILQIYGLHVLRFLVWMAQNSIPCCKLKNLGFEFDTGFLVFWQSSCNGLQFNRKRRKWTKRHPHESAVFESSFESKVVSFESLKLIFKHWAVGIGVPSSTVTETFDSASFFSILNLVLLSCLRSTASQPVSRTSVVYERIKQQNVRIVNHRNWQKQFLNPYFHWCK